MIKAHNDIYLKASLTVLSEQMYLSDINDKNLLNLEKKFINKILYKKQQDIKDFQTMNMKKIKNKK